MKASEIFSQEIGYIVNRDLRNIVRDTLDSAPECITTIPASSTGKYHAQYSLGNGGLTRHVKSVVSIAHDLMKTDIFINFMFDFPEEIDIEQLIKYKDIVYASTIIHDCCKPDDSPSHYTKFDHPLLASELFKKCAVPYINKSNNAYMKEVVTAVYNCVASHMGEWNTANYAKGIVLPKPSNKLEEWVHMCDYLGSRKYIEFNFDAWNEVKDSKGKTE